MIEEGEMRCVICKGLSISEKEVEEEIKVDNDVVFISIKVMVCEECGEKYYSRRIMEKLEKIERDIREKKISLKEAGRILKPAIAV